MLKQLTFSVISLHALLYFFLPSGPEVKAFITTGCSCISLSNNFTWSAEKFPPLVILAFPSIDFGVPGMTSCEWRGWILFLGVRRCLEAVLVLFIKKLLLPTAERLNFTGVTFFDILILTHNYVVWNKVIFIVSDSFQRVVNQGPQEGGGTVLPCEK